MANSFGSRSTLAVDGQTYTLHRLSAVEKSFPQAARLPFSLKILLENLLRNEDGLTVRPTGHRGAGQVGPEGRAGREIAFTPAAC